MITEPIKDMADGLYSPETSRAIRRAVEQLHPVFVAMGWEHSCGHGAHVPTDWELVHTIGLHMARCAEELRDDSSQHEAQVDGGRIQVTARRIGWNGPTAEFAVALYVPVSTTTAP